MKKPTAATSTTKISSGDREEEAVSFVDSSGAISGSSSKSWESKHDQPPASTRRVERGPLLL